MINSILNTSGIIGAFFLGSLSCYGSINAAIQWRKEIPQYDTEARISHLCQTALRVPVITTIGALTGYSVTPYLIAVAPISIPCISIYLIYDQYHARPTPPITINV